MEITLNTPALLFPAISLLMLAYTNRFLALASLIRKLYADYQMQKTEGVFAQIQSLQLRIYLVQAMQACGILSLLFCTISMTFIYTNLLHWGALAFGDSLFCMMMSLFFSIWEIHISTAALTILLKDLKQQQQKD